MKTVLAMASCVVWLVVGSSGFRAAEVDRASPPVNQEDESVTLTVVYDNRSGGEAITSGWGFACVVRGLEKTILFDTGADSEGLLSNMSALGIAPDEVDLVAISHAHNDHAGGLEGFLDARGAVPVYLLESFPASIAEAARERGCVVQEVTEPVTLCDGARLTGELTGAAGIPEQSLILVTEGSAALVTGCAHPGIVEIVRASNAISDGKVEMVVGGFHLMRETPESVGRVIVALRGEGVELAAPCHCTGDGAIEAFRDAYGDCFVSCMAGTTIEISEMLGSARYDR